MLDSYIRRAIETGCTIKRGSISGTGSDLQYRITKGNYSLLLQLVGNRVFHSLTNIKTNASHYGQSASFNELLAKMK